MIDLAYFTALILVVFRMMGFFLVVPVFFPKGLPNMAKIALIFIISYILLPGINYSTISITSNYTLIFYVINELITGLTLGFLTNICFYAIRMAGQLIDFQIGFSMVNMFDPATSSNSTVLENLLYWCSLILFLLIDGHHMLIRALIESYNTLALGKSVLTSDSINFILGAFVEFFSIGLKIAVPVVLIILITDIVLGLIGRTVPQLNLMILGMPIKVIIGLTALVAVLPVLLKVFVSSFGSIQDLLRGFFKIVPVALVFASEDKTEEATPKKKSEAKKKGQVARSKEVGLAFTLLASTLVLVALGTYGGLMLKDTLNMFLSNYLSTNIDYNSLKSLTLLVVWRAGITILPLVLPIMVLGIMANFIQVGFMFTKEPIKPQLSKINPINGFKRIFSARTVVETLKDLLIVVILGYTGYSFVKDNYSSILNMGSIRLNAISSVFGNLVINIFFKITIIMIIIALADYIYQRYQYNKELKMTKQEVKEEFKQQEGDPQIKSRIRQRQREMASRRMMQAVPDATVVVTNPTHIACALKYAEGENSAPKLVAKGADNLAIRIKNVAKENNVPIIENRSLARLIYSQVELDDEIPVEMYQAVAEILALVYKMKRK